MVDKNPIQTAGRRRRRQERFGMLSPVCILCVYPHLEALAAVKPDWLKQHGIPEDVVNRFLEEHHIDGRRHDPELVVPLCLNCHRVVTEGLLQAGVSMRHEKDPIAWLALMMDAEAVFFELFAESQRRKAELLRTIPACEGLKSE